MVAEILSIRKYATGHFQWLRNPTRANTKASDARTFGISNSVRVSP